MTGFTFSPGTGYSAGVIKKKIAELVERERGHAPVTVRRIKPTNTRDRAQLCQIVYDELANLSYASNAGNLARLTGLSPGMVTELLRLLTEQGRVEMAGERMRASASGLERTWVVAS